MTGHVPKGSFTTEDYMKRYGCQYTKARCDLKAMVLDGKLLKTSVVLVYYTPAGKIDPCPTAQKSKRTKKT